VSVLEVANVTVNVGGSDVLRDVSLQLGEGTWCTVIGPNGAGKTTLVESMAGVRSVTTGVVHVDSHDILSLSERERARLIAFVPQNPIVPPGMSVRDYVTLGRTSHHGLLRAPSRADRQAVAATLERLDLARFVDRDVATLSGGERQRMILARALAQSTPVLILDEPITGLDVRHQIDLLTLLRREVRECSLTVIATLHDLTLAGQFADRLLLLRAGAVVADGPSREVIRSKELSESYEMGLRVVDVDGADVVVPVSNSSATT